jgi:hypothetical protein
MRLAKGAQSRQKPAGCEGADDPDADDAPEVTLLEPLQRCPQPAERFRDGGNQSLSFIGQCQPAGQPAKQLNAEARLEALDLMADGRLTDRSSIPALVKLRWRADASNARNALSGRWDFAMPRP